MFAVIRTGGKQYRVTKDEKIVVEKLAGEPGAVVELSDVLLIGGDGKKATVGAPVIDKAAVFAEVVEQSRADKILVFKKNRRKKYRRTRGHRQEQTVLRIVDVSPTGVKPKAGADKAKPKGEKPEAKTETKPKVAEKKALDKKTDKKAETKAKAPTAKKEAKTDPNKKPAAKKKPTAKPKSKE